MRKKVTNMIRTAVCFFLVGALTLHLGEASSANAQLITSLSNKLQTKYYSVELYTNSIPELQSVITVKKKDALLSEVIKDIAQKSNLGFAINSEIEILDKRINVDLKDISTGDALQYVLLGTGYEAAISNRRELLLLKKPAPEKQIEAVQKKLTGLVQDAATGESIPAVNVFVKGTSIGTSTDGNGNFELTVPDDAEILVFRFVGYKLLEVPIVSGQNYYEVNLVQDLVFFEDLVVVGYGTQQRSEVTGSVTSIRTEEIQNVPVSSFENALQGRMAGVNVAESTGEPGSSPQILIRGTGSISAGNDPLFVIDGVPVAKSSNLQPSINTQNPNFQPTKANPMSTLNPNDIESIEVLKDASSAAIYGSRGSNGVILVTTKKGQAGKTRVTFSGYGGVSTVFNQPDVMNAEELIAYTKDSRNNNYEQDIADGKVPANPSYNPNTNAGRPAVGDPGYSVNYLIPESMVNWDGTDTDWLDLIFSNATMQNYDLSVSGGNDVSTYYFSAGYLNQEGVLEGSEFDRYTVKLNLTHKLSNLIEIGTSINTALTQHDRLPANSPYFGTPPGIVYSALVHSPTVKPYNADGSFNQTDNQSHLGGATTSASNPLAIMAYIEEKFNQSRIFGNTYGKLNINDNLSFKTLVGYNLDNSDQHYYSGTKFLYRDQTSSNPFAQSGAGKSFNWLWENTLNYTKTFNNVHSVNAVAGYSAQKQTDEMSVIYAQGFTDDQIKTVNGGIISGGDDLKEEWSIVSALARVNYAYKSKYLFTGTIRADRSSRFGSDDQTGIFPSFSLGWRLTEESFMPGQDIFNELKLRASYGVTGNFEIPNYGSIGLLGTANYPFGSGVNIGVGPTTLANPNLTWETTYQLDVGVDYAMLSDRIYGSFDYYKTTTKDLLLFVNVPASTGYSTALTNIGEVENNGVEFSITTRNLVGDFQWATDFNIAKNSNKVTKLGPEGDPILSSGAAGSRHITMIGEEIGSYYGYQVEGIYQNQAEIAAAPTDMLAPNPRPGDFRFKDVNGDGKIDANDRTVIGSYHPDFTYGITNRFNYKNIDLSVFIQGVQGRDVMNLTSRHMLNGEANFNAYSALKDRWMSESEPGKGKHPREDRSSNNHGNNNRESSYQVEDGSYLKIKNVTLGYTLTQEKVSKFVSRARIYVSASNLAIFTKYLGFNPEVSLQTNSLTPGEDYGAYPLSRTIQVGIDLAF